MRIDTLFNFEKGNLQSSKCIPGEYDFITASSDWKKHNSYSHDCEALIFAAAASGSLGRTHYVNGKFISSDLCFILTPKDDLNLPIDLKFYQLVFNELKDEIVRNTKAGTSKEAIGLGSFGKFILPYFNIEKQIEIKNHFVESHEIKVALSTELTHQLNLLKKLRQQLLQDAVQGKLSSAMITDELPDEHDLKQKHGNVWNMSGKELLAHIKAEKATLRQAQGSNKKEKELPPIKPTEIPFEIPENWAWCKLGEILTEVKYGTSHSCDYDSNKNSKVLRIPNISGDCLTDSDLKFANLNSKEIQELSLEESDILIIRSNGSRELVGKTALVTSEFSGYAYAGYLVRLRFNKLFTNPKYLISVTKSSFFRKLIETPLRTTVGINNINTEEISKLLVPLPPLSEQHRIVQKLEKIMQTCDVLESSIQESLLLNEKLLQQVLREAMSGE